MEGPVAWAGRRLWAVPGRARKQPVQDPGLVLSPPTRVSGGSLKTHVPFSLLRKPLSPQPC